MVVLRITYSEVSSNNLKGNKAHEKYIQYNMFFSDFSKTEGTFFQPLSWNTRVRMALGAARGLAFLHNAQPQVIYRDFKASNILLDSVRYMID